QPVLRLVVGDRQPHVVDPRRFGRMRAAQRDLQNEDAPHSAAPGRDDRPREGNRKQEEVVMTDSESVLDSQLRYYDGLAWEFDETILPHFDPAMLAMLKRMRAGNIKGDTLELASGTGYWTRYLSELSDSVTC